MSRSRLLKASGALAFVAVWSIGVCIPAFIFEIPYAMLLMAYGLAVMLLGIKAGDAVDNFLMKRDIKTIK